MLLSEDPATLIHHTVDNFNTQPDRQAVARVRESLGDASAPAAGGDPAAPRTSYAVDDEVLLRLKVYRSLGIDIERDERDGEWSRAVIRNDRKGDVHVVNMDKKFSRYFYANYFWQTL
ncbi:hypothetical protein HIM_02681 [Hirsutella minnesotensis 3608]|nr:hypothetical protein HIM_02681 [Hirsutella minnesotensis 3608]